MKVKMDNMIKKGMKKGVKKLEMKKTLKRGVFLKKKSYKRGSPPPLI